MKVFFENAVSQVYYDEALDAVFLKYLGRPKNEQDFIAINTELLNAFKKLSTQKLVVDLRKMGVIGVNSQQWVADTLIPALFSHLKGKVLYHAQLLDPKEIFSKVSGSNIKNKVAVTHTAEIEIIQFYDEEEMKQQLMKW